MNLAGTSQWIDNQWSNHCFVPAAFSIKRLSLISGPWQNIAMNSNTQNNWKLHPLVERNPDEHLRRMRLLSSYRSLFVIQIKWYHSWEWWNSPNSASFRSISFHYSKEWYHFILGQIKHTFGHHVPNWSCNYFCDFFIISNEFKMNNHLVLYWSTSHDWLISYK